MKIEKNFIQTVIENSKELDSFILPLFYYLYDCLRRKVCLKTVAGGIRDFVRNQAMDKVNRNIEKVC